jgi:uncharacterized protein (TIGR04255 family)
LNRIVFDDAGSVGDWRSLVRPELLGLAASTELVADEHVMHTFGQARLAQDESQMLVRYGLIEPGTPIHPTVEPTDTTYFLLDLDHFDVRHFPDIDVSETIAQLDAFHEDIHRVFRWSLSESAAHRLGAGMTEEETQPEAVRA